MFVRKRKTTPEEKLLRVIENSPASVHSHRDINIMGKVFSLKRIFTFNNIKRINILDLANKLLFITAGICTIFFIITLTKRYKDVELEKKPSILSSAEKKERLKEYVQLIKNKNAFGVDFGVSGKKEEVVEEKINYKLVGILSMGIGKVQALIEDENNKTYMCSEGDIVGDNVKVEKIGQDRVILNKDGKTIELQ